VFNNIRLSVSCDGLASYLGSIGSLLVGGRTRLMAEVSAAFFFFLKMIVLEFTIAQYVNCASNARVFDLGRESREKKDPPVHHGKHYNTFASSSNRTTTRRLLVRQSNRLLTLDASVVVSAGNLSEGEQRFD